MEFSDEIVDSTRTLCAAAKEKAATLKKQTDEAMRVQRAWEGLLESLEKGRPLHVLSMLDREAPLLKRMRAESHPAVPGLEEAYRLARQQADMQKKRFPKLFEDACNEAKLPLDLNSRHPRYAFSDSFFQLEINDHKGMARLSDNEGRLAECPADIDAIIETVQAEHTRVFGRAFDGKRFLKKLRSQYLAVLKRDKQEDGAAVPIRHITRRLGKNVKGFRSDEFLIDLSRLVEQGPMEIDGRRLDLQQTKDTKQGMLLHGAARRGYVGFVLFRET